LCAPRVVGALRHRRCALLQNQLRKQLVFMMPVSWAEMQAINLRAARNKVFRCAMVGVEHTLA
jgi:hypothetical protein